MDCMYDLFLFTIGRTEKTKRKAIAMERMAWLQWQLLQWPGNTSLRRQGLDLIKATHQDENKPYISAGGRTCKEESVCQWDERNQRKQTAAVSRARCESHSGMSGEQDQKRATYWSRRLHGCGCHPRGYHHSWHHGRHHARHLIHI